MKVSEALALAVASSMPGLHAIVLSGLFHMDYACHHLWDAYDIENTNDTY